MVKMKKTVWIALFFLANGLMAQNSSAMLPKEGKDTLFFEGTKKIYNRKSVV